MSALDAEVCAFECGRNATGVRGYRRGASSVWLGACDACDQRARIDLARAESKFNRQMTTPLSDEVLDDEVHMRQQQRGYRDARTPEKWEQIRRKDRERTAQKRRQVAARKRRRSPSQNREGARA